MWVICSQTREGEKERTVTRMNIRYLKLVFQTRETLESALGMKSELFQS